MSLFQFVFVIKCLKINLHFIPSYIYGEVIDKVLLNLNRCLSLLCCFKHEFLQ